MIANRSPKFDHLFARTPNRMLSKPYHRKQLWRKTRGREEDIVIANSIVGGKASDNTMKDNKKGERHQERTPNEKHLFKLLRNWS